MKHYGKKLAGMIGSAVLAVSLLAGCGNGTGSAASKTESGTGKHKVYLITMDQMDQHWRNVDAGCQEAVASLGTIDYTWLAPDVKDDAKQIECINNAVAGGAQVILLAANGPDAVDAALEEVADAGVKIIYVDSAANFEGEATYATDNYAAGVKAGEAMLEELKTRGITTGDIGVINVNAATASCVSREEGFRAAFEGTDFNIVETQYCEGDAAKAKDIVSTYITQGIVGILGTNEGSTVGCGNAIQEAGTEVVGIGFDKSDTIGELITSGYLYATMAQNPDVMGRSAMEAADKVLRGEVIDEKVVDTGVSVLKKEDFEQ